MNEDADNIDPVDLSPTRAELIARVRARGRQIRARRRLAVTALTALVVLAIAAPAIAIGTRSSSHGVTPATVAPVRHALRIAPVRAVQQPPCPTGAVLSPDLGKTCLSLGAAVADERDVLSASVVNAGKQGWTVRVRLDARTAPGLRPLKPGSRVAFIIGKKVVDALSIEPGGTSDAIEVVEPHLGRADAIQLATKILGRPPSHVNAPSHGLSTSIELPGTTLVAGTDVHATLVIDNETGAAMTLESGPCRAKWALTLTNASVPLSVTFTADCAVGQTVLKPGENRFPVTITANYTACTGAADAGLVPCLPGGAIPPLPTGDYHVVLTTDPPDILPAPPTVAVHVVAATPSLGPLSIQTGDRSTKLLVPAGWKFGGIDAGGSGSSSTLTNPADPHEEIYGATGVELGGWWERDGVNGSIDPSGFFPKGSHTHRVNYTTFLYQVDAPGGYVTDGVWIANVTSQGPDSYVMAHVTLPSALHVTATTILNRFISDRNAVFPPLAGPPPAFVRP